MVISSKITLSKKKYYDDLKNMWLITSSKPKGESRLSGQNCQGSTILGFYCLFIKKSFEICLEGLLLILPTPLWSDRDLDKWDPENFLSVKRC